VVKSGVLSCNISSFPNFSNGKGEKGKNRDRMRNGHREIGNLWTKVREGKVRNFSKNTALFWLLHCAW
jgi:hypothetical protein